MNIHGEHATPIRSYLPDRDISQTCSRWQLAVAFVLLCLTATGLDKWAAPLLTSPSPRTRQPPYNAQDEGDNEVVVLFDAIDRIVQAGNKVTEKSVKWVESHV